jgi:hypothetical protein
MDHPDYKYQPRRKKIKSLNGSVVDEKQTSPAARKAGRRSKKQLENEEIDDNDSEDNKGYRECINYGTNYDNRTSSIPNYSAFSSPSYTLQTPQSIEGMSSMAATNPSFQSNFNDYYMRKYDTLQQNSNNKNADSPHSSTEELSMTTPEASISSTISTASATLTRAITPNGNFRELSPSLIASHSIMKEDYAASDCAYRTGVDETNNNTNKDMNLISKYNQESYRIYSHQLHHHHHYHYALQTPPHGSSSSSSGSSVNYPSYQAPYATPIDTDVDPKEMEQYLDSGGKYRKLCYLKPENSLTELTPMATHPLSDAQNYYQSIPKSDNLNGLMQIHNNEPIILPNQVSNVNYASNNYVENSAPSSSHPYSNWVNYSI